MKLISKTALVLFLSLAFIACKKDSGPSFVMEGKWEGKLGTGIAIPNSYFGMVLKGNGTLDRLNSIGSVAATGTWSLSGDEFTAMYTFASGTVVTLKGTVNKAQHFISGTWKNNADEEGKWNATQKAD